MSPDVETMMPKILKTAGYVSSCIGKWGQLPLGPGEFGFDDYLKFRGSGVYWGSKKKAEKYFENGDEKALGEKDYMPDLMHTHLINFITQHRDEPFYVYYAMSHVHGELQPTPDSGPDPKDLLADNVAYMDKLVGKLVSELERLKLRDNTLLVFMGDNGTGHNWAKASTIRGRPLSGAKGEMLEGGAHVPLIANWPGVTPAGQVSEDMVDSTDFVPTFAEIAGAALPETNIIDGHSINAQLHGTKGTPREWIFVELARNWYVREAGWKLNEANELYDMSDSPFTEKLIPPDNKDPAAVAARARLAAALARLNPAGGVLDDGDGTGRHANKDKKKGKATTKTETGADPRPAPVLIAQTPLVPADASLAERGAKFDKLDKEKTGKLSLEYYTTHQSDAEAAAKRFEKFDVNKDGVVTRDEYINNGAKKLKSQ
jgi:arylsulfatase A